MTATTLARTTDPITSKLAAKSIKSTQTPLMMRLLDQFAKKSQTSEMAGEAAGLLHTGYWKRVSDLVTAGYIEKRTQGTGWKQTVMTWPNRSGRKATVWKITPAGREALRAYKAQKTD